MSILLLPKIGGFFMWLIKNRKTKLKDEIWHDTWVSWVVGVVAVVVIVWLGARSIGWLYE